MKALRILLLVTFAATGGLILLSSPNAGAVTSSIGVSSSPETQESPGLPPDPSPSETPSVDGSQEPDQSPSEISPTPPTPGESAGPTPDASSSGTTSPQTSPDVSPLPSQLPGTPASFQDSSIPIASVLIALLVLGIGGVVIGIVSRKVARGPKASVVPERTTEPIGASTTTFLVALGEAMIDAGDPVTHVRGSLLRVAAANGVPDAEVVVMATALFVSVPGDETVQTAVASAGSAGLRLEQTDALFGLVSSAETGDVRPTEGILLLASIRSMPPGFGPTARVFGYVVLTAGLALILGAGWAEVLLASVLGLAVGLVLRATTRFPSSYRVFAPVLCAFGVALTVFLLARRDLDIGIFAPLIAPLVTFLPGALLTTSVIELSTGQMISGAGRLAAGSVQLILLALGIVAAAQLVGVPTSSVVTAAAQPLGAWSPWVGVAIFGCGVVVHHCARPASLGWILLVLYVAYAGQVLGGLFFGAVLSAFVGALVMTPVAMLAATQRSGPPTLVSFLPAFWLLVPGALGLVGVTKYLGEDRAYGAAALVTAGATMVGIALGVLLGLAAGGAIAAAGDRRHSLGD